MRRVFKFLTAVIILAVIAGGTALAQINYSCWLGVEDPNLAPGGKVEFNVGLNARGDSDQLSKGAWYTIEIRRVDVEKLIKSGGDEKSAATLVKTIKKRVNFSSWKAGKWNQVSDKVEYTPQTKGYYVATLRFKSRKSRQTFRVSNLGVVFKTSSDRAVVFVSDPKKGVPVPGVSLSLLHRKSREEYRLGSTGDDGVLAFPLIGMPEVFAKNRELVLLGRKDGDMVLCVSSKPYHRDGTAGYVFTDRPVYRPGQKVHFKAVLRSRKGRKLTPLSEKAVRVEILDSKGTKVLNRHMITSKYGSIDGEITLKEEPPLGRYQVIVRHGSTSRATFEVEEYRKPEFEITVKPDKNFVTGGGNTVFALKAKYYFGEPVADTPFKYQLIKQVYRPFSRYHYWWLPTYPGYYHSRGEVVARGKGKTDGKGMARVKYKIPKSPFNNRYNLVVSMTDQSRREVAGSGTVTATAGDFYLTARAERYFYKPSDKVRVKLAALDYKQKPVKTRIRVKVTRRWYEKSKRQEDTFLEKEIETDSEGKAVFELVPDRSGYFVVYATAADSRDNRVSAVTNFYAASGRGGYWYNFASLDLNTDREFYRYDEQIGVMASGVKPGRWALVTVEGDDIYQYRVVPVDSNVKLLKFKAEPYMSPNVYVSVVYWDGGKLYSSSRKVVVPAWNRFLKVEIKPDREEYGPRKYGTFTITTTGSKGEPVSAEVTMGVADESIYAVSPDNTSDIQKFFYGSRYNRVRTRTSILTSFRGDIETEGAMPPPAPGSNRLYSKSGEKRNGGPKDFVQPEFVREFFPDTAYFNPSIITDEYGSAVVRFQFPDSLTTWRATARAASMRTQVGQATRKVIVKKNLMVRLITPRFMVEGDKAMISGIVHNYLDRDVESRVTLNAEGLNIIDKPAVMIKVPKNGKTRVQWMVDAARSGKANLKVSALTRLESDAMALDLPVNPHGVKIVNGGADSGGTDASLALNMPKGAPAHSASLVINVSPSIAGTIIPAISYLAKYPYGCVEQTMNRFVPNAIVQRSLEKFGIKNEKLARELPRMMKKGFDRLYDYQHSDGGWGWWKNDKSHPYMTAYVIYGFATAKKAGYKVRQNALREGVRWVERNHAGQKDPKIRTYMTFALASAGIKKQAWAMELYELRDKLDNYSLACLAIALKVNDRNDLALSLVKSLESSAVSRGAALMWKGRGARSWTDDPVETTSMVVRAIMAVNPKNPAAEKGIRYLVAARRGNRWTSTKDTAAAVLALIDYVDLTGEMNPEFTARVNLNGKLVKEVSFTKSDVASGGLEIKVPGEQLKSGRNEILVTKQGPGRVYLSGALTGYVDYPRIPALNNGISVTREYFLVKTGKVGGKGEVLKKLDTREPIVLHPQDQVEVRLTLKGDSLIEYLMIQDYKPAGCEAVEKKTGRWHWWYAQREFRDELVSFFATYFHKGTRVLRYRLRAETPGIYRALPATARMMYFPGVGGRSAEAEFRVLED